MVIGAGSRRWIGALALVGRLGAYALVRRLGAYRLVRGLGAYRLRGWFFDIPLYSSLRHLEA